MAASGAPSAASEVDRSALETLDQAWQHEHLTLGEAELLPLLDDPDPKVRRRAAVVLLRAEATPEGTARLAAWARTAPAADLRVFAEYAPPPIAAERAAVARAVLARVEPHHAALAADLAARFEPTAGVLLLAELLGPTGPGHPAAREVALRSLAGIARAEDVGIAIPFAADPDPRTRAAARDVVSRVVARECACGRADEALAAVRDARAAAPLDRGLARREAMVLGFALGREDEAAALLEEFAARRLPAPAGRASLDAAELLCDRAALQLAAGDAASARATCARALGHIGRPAEGNRPHELALARAHLVAALVEGAVPDDAGARRHVAQAIRAAPFDRDVCRFDEAGDGSFGAKALLDVLLRRGRVAEVLAFGARLDEALAEPEIARGIGFPEASAAAGSPEPRDLDPPARSWWPLLHARRLRDIGWRAEAIAQCERILSATRDREAWADRQLLAEAQVTLALALSDGRSDAACLQRAEDLLRKAVDLLERDGDLLVEYELEERDALPAPGDAPPRSPLRERLAAARGALSSLLERRPERALDAALEAEKAHRAAPEEEIALLRHARFLAQRPEAANRARAARALASVAPAVDRLFDLARVAGALGDAQACAALLERHLAWNGHTAARVALDAERVAADPAFDLVRDDPAVRALLRQ